MHPITIPMGLLMRAAAAGSGELTAAYLQNTFDGANSTTYTFTAENLGPASSDRYIVVAIGGRSVAVQTIASVSIGGVTATEIVQSDAWQNSASNATGLYYALVPSGTSGDVVVTWTGAMVRCGIGLWSITGGSLAVSDSAAGTPGGVSADVDIVNPDGGFVICSAMTGVSGTYAWTNADERFDQAVETGTHSGADTDAEGALNVIATVGTATCVLVAVAVTIA